MATESSLATNKYIADALFLSGNLSFLSSFHIIPFYAAAMVSRYLLRTGIKNFNITEKVFRFTLYVQP